jgi:hypothetical protein
MPVNESTPLYNTRDITAQASAAITGKRFVEISAEPTSSMLALSATSDGSNVQVAPCGAGAKAFGVAAYDAADNAKVPVHGPPKTTVVTAGGTVAAGEEVESDATGRAITLAAGISNGICLQGATVGNDAVIALH